MSGLTLIPRIRGISHRIDRFGWYQRVIPGYIMNIHAFALPDRTPGVPREVPS